MALHFIECYDLNNRTIFFCICPDTKDLLFIENYIRVCQMVMQSFALPELFDPC